MTKLISIIIPVYNEEKTIKIILDKVLKQNDLNKEIIVINDFSTDNTKSLIEDEFLDKITAYSLATSSLQRTSLQAAQDDKKKSEYQDVVAKLREELNNLNDKDGVSIVEGTVGDLKVRLDATQFAFNSD